MAKLTTSDTGNNDKGDTLDLSHLRKVIEDLESSDTPIPYFVIGVRESETEMNIAGIIVRIGAKEEDDNGNVCYQGFLNDIPIGRIYESAYLR